MDSGGTDGQDLLLLWSRWDSGKQERLLCRSLSFHMTGLGTWGMFPGHNPSLVLTGKRTEGEGHTHTVPGWEAQGSRQPRSHPQDAVWIQQALLSCPSALRSGPSWAVPQRGDGSWRIPE